MKTYIIKVNDLYYVGEGESQDVKVRRGEGWYSFRTEAQPLLFGEHRDTARRIEGLINLNSHYQRIYNAMKFDGFEVGKIEMLEESE